MLRLLLVFSLIVPPAAALRAQPAAIAFPGPPDSLRIVVLGSSTAAGAGSSVRDSAWVWKYRTSLSGINPSWEVVNLAVGGYSTYHLQPSGFQWPAGRPRPDTLRNITRALSLRPSAVIINLPSNDAASNFSIVEQTENFERIVSEAARAMVPVWVSTTQPRNFEEAKRQNLITMRDWIHGRFDDRALDFWTGLASDDGMLLAPFNAGDGIHLNDDGHALLYTRVRDADIPDHLAQITWIASTAPPVDFDLHIYPNPAHTTTTLRLNNSAAGTLRIFLQDMLGRTVLHARERYAPAGDTYTRLDVSSLPTGMYLLVAQSPAGISHATIVISR